MPQIWMTYEEVADLLECGREQAIARIHHERLDRRISRDGHKRAKLNLALTRLFLDRVWAQGSAETAPLDRAIDGLRQIHARMIDYDSLEHLLFEKETTKIEYKIESKIESKIENTTENEIKAIAAA